MQPDTNQHKQSEHDCNMHYKHARALVRTTPIIMRLHNVLTKHISWGLHEETTSIILYAAMQLGKNIIIAIISYIASNKAPADPQTCNK